MVVGRRIRFDSTSCNKNNGMLFFFEMKCWFCLSFLPSLSGRPSPHPAALSSHHTHLPPPALQPHPISQLPLGSPPPTLHRHGSPLLAQSNPQPSWVIHGAVSPPPLLYFPPLHTALMALPATSSATITIPSSWLTSHVHHPTSVHSSCLVSCSSYTHQQITTRPLPWCWHPSFNRIYHHDNTQCLGRPSTTMFPVQRRPPYTNRPRRPGTSLTNVQLPSGHWFGRARDQNP